MCLYVTIVRRKIKRYDHTPITFIPGLPIPVISFNSLFLPIQTQPSSSDSFALIVNIIILIKWGAETFLTRKKKTTYLVFCFSHSDRSFGKMITFLCFRNAQTTNQLYISSSHRPNKSVHHQQNHCP